MYNTDMPTRNELPSTARLIRSTIIAAFVALVLLVTVVMPAEYALDPTGAGRVLGLTEMGEIKEQLAEEAAADAAAQMMPVQSYAEVSTPEPVEPVTETAAAPAAEAEPTPTEPVPAPAAETEWQDEVRFVLTPGQGTEFKLTMNQGAVARFAWATEGGPVNFDTHGDGGGRSISYEKGRGVPEDEGELEAAFTGNHGWFFRNRNDNDVTLVLRTGGDYGELKKML
ncbi:hypothetical protein [Marinobacter halophilus]|uniref:Transmembrane anchor protein n=1 Tax=Marinobacter halophilus TaxID=1323740 RepID=A0A2T1KEB1_9GAMM|nr:hypothetical protein [Marinobacter halophilus]PSF08457.1 hypothetical protein C7H08_07150 [Marinobacter halophilus]GGC60755.1 hypothetical protein GCM10011362_06550 [Marinobacter halophilus]